MPSFENYHPPSSSPLPLPAGWSTLLVIVVTRETSSQWKFLLNCSTSVFIVGLIECISISFERDHVADVFEHDVSYQGVRRVVSSSLASLRTAASRSRWSPSTYTRPYSWHRAGEGRTRLCARRDARTLTHWLATPHTLLPFRRVLARVGEKRETVKEEAFTGALLSSDKETPRFRAFIVFIEKTTPNLTENDEIIKCENKFRSQGEIIIFVGIQQKANYLINTILALG